MSHLSLKQYYMPLIQIHVTYLLHCFQPVISQIFSVHLMKVISQCEDMQYYIRRQSQIGQAHKEEGKDSPFTWDNHI